MDTDPKFPTLDEILDLADAPEGSGEIVEEAQSGAEPDYSESYVPEVAPASRAATTRLTERFDVPPDRALADVHSSLGVLQRFMYNRAVEKLKREGAVAIAKRIMDYEYEAIVQKLTLSLDIEKKRTFIEYMYAAQGLQKEILMVVSTSVSELADTLINVRFAISDNINRQRKKVSDRHNRGDLTDLEAKEEYELIARLRRKILDEATNAAGRLHENSIVLLTQALTLFRDDLAERGLI